MKKLGAVLLIAVIALSFSIHEPVKAASTTGCPKSPEQSKEWLYHDIFITLLEPHINKAIDSYYKDYLTYTRREDPWSVGIINIERESFQFVIKLEVLPYIGPHNSVGIDHITFKVSPSGKVTMEKFEHIRSFDIAPNYKSIIKKWPPEAKP